MLDRTRSGRVARSSEPRLRCLPVGSCLVYNAIPLNQLHAGVSGRVVEVLGLPDQVQRVRELGIRDGIEVQMVQAGSPCIVRVAGQTLCFRATDLLSVLVEPGVAG